MDPGNSLKVSLLKHSDAIAQGSESLAEKSNSNKLTILKNIPVSSPIATSSNYRSSTNNNRTSEGDKNVDINKLAAEIFKKWDRKRMGYISTDKIKLSNIDSEFLNGLKRILSTVNSSFGNSTIQNPVIRCKDVQICINTLMFGSMKEKVKLLVIFLDSHGNQTISFEEAQMYMKYAPKSLYEKLGFIDKNGKSKTLSYHDILRLFENSPRGNEAINIFCERILKILFLQGKKPRQSIYLQNIEVINPIHSFHNILYMIRNFSKPTYFIIILTSLQIFLWLYNFFEYKRHQYPIAFCVAKGFGLNLRILTLLLFFTMARTIMGLLHGFQYLKPFIPMGFNVQIHSFCGFCSVFHAVGHLIAHIVDHSQNVPGGFLAAFTQPSLIRGFSWDKQQSGDAITGFLLLGSLLVMAMTALLRSHGSKLYSIFTNIHFLYTFWLFILILHVPWLWTYLASIIIIVASERIYDLLQLTTHSTLATSRPCANGVTFLSILKRNSPYPGCFYRIRIPAISLTEWHPFSLAGSVSSHHLVFFIASAGDWTKRLHEIVSDPLLRKNTIVQLQGPFSAPARRASTRRPNTSILLVASGIGITPFFSVMATKVTDEQNYQHDREVFSTLFNENLGERRSVFNMQQGGSSKNLLSVLQMSLTSGVPGLLDENNNHDEEEGEDGGDGEGTVKDGQEEGLMALRKKILRVVWAVRDANELMFYIDYVYQLVKHQDTLKRHVVMVDVYLTGLGEGTDPKFMMSQTLFLLSLSAKTSEYMNIHFGRPNLIHLVGIIQPEEVYCCGGKALKETLQQICNQEKIEFYSEDFESGHSITKTWHENIRSWWEGFDLSNGLSAFSTNSNGKVNSIQMNNVSSEPNGYRESDEESSNMDSFNDSQFSASTISHSGRISLSSHITEDLFTNDGNK